MKLHISVQQWRKRENHINYLSHNIPHIQEKIPKTCKAVRLSQTMLDIPMTVTLNSHVALLPETSWAEMVTSVVPMGNLSPSMWLKLELFSPSLSVILTIPQLTVALGAPLSVFILISLGHGENCGSSLSIHKEIAKRRKKCERMQIKYKCSQLHDIVYLHVVQNLSNLLTKIHA